MIWETNYNMKIKAKRYTPEDFLKSSFYEQLVEHVFISEVLQEAWFRYGKTVEVLRSEIDSSGYDVLLECNGVSRHVQLKTTRPESKTAYQKINIALQEKPSGCVIWLLREEDESAHRVKLQYRFFGGAPGEQLPSLKDFKVAKHTKGDAKGIKKERPAMRKVPKGKFIQLAGIRDLVERLFGLSEHNVAGREKGDSLLF